MPKEPEPDHGRAIADFPSRTLVGDAGLADSARMAVSQREGSTIAIERIQGIELGKGQGLVAATGAVTADGVVHEVGAIPQRRPRPPGRVPRCSSSPSPSPRSPAGMSGRA